MMTFEEKIEYWIDSSAYDLGSAKIMQQSGRYTYTVVMCQQSIEKYLKALHLRINKNEAPKSHNLIYLSELTNLKITDDDKLFLAELSSFYISGRYPDYKKKISSLIDKEKAEYYLDRTEGFLQWMKYYLEN